MLDSEPLLSESLHDGHMHDAADEADETLSLCDLPLYSQDQTVEEWGQDLATESQGSSSISSSHDYFEFFSQELSPPAATFPPENIIFCGKIIPYKQPDNSQKEPSKVVENKKQTNSKKKHNGWGIFSWKFSPSKSSKGTTPVMQKKTYNTNKRDKGYDFPDQKMSILTSSSSGKARWYLVFFGISRLSTEVDLRDIKSRQSRRYSSAPTPPPSPALRFQNHHEEKTGGERDRSSGLWGLIRVLSCGRNHHPNAMVVSSSHR